MQEILKAAIDKAKISGELTVQLDISFDEEDFQAIHDVLKTSNRIQTITINANNGELSLEYFALIIFPLLQSTYCNSLKLQNFYLDESLMGNLYSLIFKKGFSMSFENVRVKEEIDGLATFLSEIKHISKCDIYESSFEFEMDASNQKKRAASFDLSSLVGKGVSSLSIYKKTSDKQLAFLPEVIDHAEFKELNIFEITFNIDTFLRVLDTIAKNPNFRALRLRDVSYTGSSASIFEKLIEVIKGVNVMEVLVLDNTVFLNRNDADIIRGFLKTIAQKKTFIELSLPYSSTYIADYTKIISNSLQLSKLEMIFSDIYGIDSGSEVDADEMHKEQHASDRHNKLVKLITAIYLHPSIIFINEEFIANPLVANVCKENSINLEETLEEKRIIHDLPYGKDIAELKRIRRFLRKNDLPSNFFSSFNNNIPSLKKLCIDKAQHVLDEHQVNIENVQKLPEDLLKEFSFK